MINPLFYSTATIDTRQSSPHNCPNCRCQRARNSPNPYTTPFHPKDNNDHMMMTFNPLKSLFVRTAPNFNESSRSTSKYNITFSYSSPIWIKKHHSSQSRFSTKKYKQTHFPHLTTKDENDEPVLQILKNKRKSEIGRKLYRQTLQQTPQKPNILKMKKVKQNRKSKETISHNSSKSLNIISKSNSLNQQLSSDLNEEEIKPQQETPVHFFKIESSKNAKSQNAVQSELPQNSKKQLQTSKEKIALKIKETQLQTPKLFQQEHKSCNIVAAGALLSQTSLNVVDLTSQKKWNLMESDREIASTISEQLALHYDYFILNQDSDRSLSLNVEL